MDSVSGCGGSSGHGASTVTSAAAMIRPSAAPVASAAPPVASAAQPVVVLTACYSKGLAAAQLRHRGILNSGSYYNSGSCMLFFVRTVFSWALYFFNYMPWYVLM